MSFGFGSGGFGQNNTNTSTFGGFGSTPSSNTGFGTTASTGFGSNTGTSGTSIFGGGGGGFGSSNTGGFGSGGFGSKPAFGTPATTSSGTGLFGSTTSTAGGTGFGSGGFGSSTANTSSPFGGGSLFGGNKPASTGFGSGTSTFGSGTGGSIFGSGTTGTTGFGATSNPGIGTNVGDPPGTAVVPFSPTVEKEASNPSQSNSFQNILFMDAYKKWSADELRLADYNQGRRTGSPGGTGAFGSSGFGTSGFGTNTGSTGFGSGTGLFGNTQQTTGGFGTTNTTTSGFGSGSGGLFGSKPATGGLFGSTSQPAQSGGLFGGSTFGSTNNTTTNAFGSNTGTTGGGLFGSTNTASKPSGFSFGSTNTGTGTSAFGATSSAPAFGSTTGTTGGGLFGSTTQSTTGGGGLFGGGQQQQQQQSGTGFGGTGFGTQNQSTGSSLFGNQQKPGGLFGSSTTTTGGTGGGLFGNTGNQSSTGFGSTTTNQQSNGGLFGSKPAGTSTGTGLFGSGTTGQTGTSGGGLFGNLGASTQNQQPAQSGSLFGGLGQTNQSKPSLFGSSTTTGGGGLFGGQNTQTQTTGLFGSSTTQQQPQASTLGSSLLGGSQAQQTPQQTFSTSINDISAYGATTLFSGLPDDKIQNPGPLATPLSGKSKTKSRSILPMYKLSPANASRLVTPQKRGYGFSFSAYGSPASPSSVTSTPGGFGQSLLASSVNRGLSKSISSSNLRRSFNVEDSILQPGAFSANSSMRLLGSSGSHKKLIINKDMRSDLFTSPVKEKPTPEDPNGARKLAKRVSFDTSTVETPDNREPTEESPNADDLGYLKPSARPSTNGVNGAKSSPVAASPEMEQVKGNELAVVREEESPAPAPSEKKPSSTIEPGAYWMSPTAEEIRAMNRMQRQRVSDFTVGRENVGSVTFKVPVDLSNINLDELFDNIVVLVPRSATVYPVAAKKPPVGKGLNVPAVISLEHSYPRGGLSTTGRRLERHIERLRTAIPDTTFESYDRETGVWTFSVEHFTTYGLGDDDDEDYDDETDVEPVQTRGPVLSPTLSKESTSPIDPDDTFEFRRSRRAVPGAFDDAALSDNEEGTNTAQRQGTLSPEPQEADAPLPSREWPEDESMADGPDDYQLEAFEQSSQQGSVEEQDDLLLSRFTDNDAQVPAGIMRARMRAVKKSTAPTRIEVTGGDDWTQILQASVRAPRTVDRATLRALNESGAVWDMKDRGSPAPQKTAPVPDGAGFATSIDLMKSLFEQAKGPSQPAPTTPAKGFVKWPYQQRPKVDTEDGPPVARPNWGPNELLVTTHHGEPSLQLVDGSLSDAEESPASPRNLERLQQYIDGISGTEDGRVAPGPDFRELAQGDSVWELASLLFDDNGHGLPAFWKQLVSEATDYSLAHATSPEEKAIICLAGNRVPDACGHLLAAGNFRLATLVASIGMQNKEIRAQLKDWRESNVLAEFSEPVRAIYELLAGNACVCAGVKGVPIENRVESFTISQRFGLDWMRSFGLRLFYTTGTTPDVAEAVRSFQSDIDQDREPQPDSALWSLLKAFANREFDWSDTRLGWLMTKAIYATGKVSFGEDAAEKLDKASLSFASSLTAHSHWVPATFVLLQLSDAGAREAAVRDHLGRHAHRIGSSRDPASAFTALCKLGVPETWIWEAKALDFRSRQDAQQEFLSLIWAGNYTEANQAFVNRVGPDLVIQRDLKRLFSYAQLLYRVRKKLPDWDRAAAVYLLYPMARLQSKHQPLDRFDNQLFDGLAALRGAARGDIRQEAAIADMAEELIRCRGGDARLYQLLPQDVRGKYMRTQALESIG